MFQDHNAQLVHGKRTCAACGQTFNRDQIRRDLGWEPLAAGWHCGDCSRTRKAAIHERAVALIDSAPARWQLVLEPLEDATDPDALAMAQQIVLDAPMPAGEAHKLREAVLSAP